VLDGRRGGRVAQRRFRVDRALARQSPVVRRRYRARGKPGGGFCAWRDPGAAGRPRQEGAVGGPAACPGPSACPWPVSPRPASRPACRSQAVLTEHSVPRPACRRLSETASRARSVLRAGKGLLSLSGFLASGSGAPITLVFGPSRTSLPPFAGGLAAARRDVLSPPGSGLLICRCRCAQLARQAAMARGSRQVQAGLRTRPPRQAGAASARRLGRLYKVGEGTQPVSAGILPAAGPVRS